MSYDSRLAGSLVSDLIGRLPFPLAKRLLDRVLDFTENIVLRTSIKADDRFILPICEMIRELLNIPDDD